ncbi:PEP-CTERM sorting domain-containing protein [Candidatus Litorirhabdus singularis]|nr:PEP-CTERM sorting domain-containing protein [Candidatus Litorirhabdus singularis]
MNYTTIGLHAVRGAIAASVLAASVGANAAPVLGWNSQFYFDLGTNKFDEARGNGTNYDADFRTGPMTSLGFGSLLATSVYKTAEIAPGVFAPTGTFYDTNNAGTMAQIVDGANAGLAAPGPNEINFNDFGGLLPDLFNNMQNGDTEGFGQSWSLIVDYTFEGNFLSGEPQYTSGTADIILLDLVADPTGGARETVVEMTVTGSAVQNALLEVFFEITDAKAGFLWIENGNGQFLDASTIENGEARLNTDVNEPIPVGLTDLTDNSGEIYAVGQSVGVRQTDLAGAVRNRVPEPGSLFLVSLGLLGLTARKKLLRK